jgi:hypothetical protein
MGSPSKNGLEIDYKVMMQNFTENKRWSIKVTI